MVPYDFLAGKLTLNHQTGRLEIECNSSSGAGFVVAAAEFSLDEIGDLMYPNPAFMQLIVHALEKFEDQPLCVFQVFTSFKCGGFALGISTNHVLFDGMSFKIFLENLASQAFDDDYKPSPPQVTFPHPELLKLNPPVGEENAPPVQDEIGRLKEEAKAATTKATGFNVVTAHIWRCKALSCGGSRDRRLRVSEMFGSGGGALLQSGGHGLRGGGENELATSTQDLHKGFPNGEFLISSWWRLGFNEVAYPWGKPRYSCPVVYHRKDIVLIFPEIGGAGSNGVNILVALLANEMDKFQSLFRKYLP
ncbi:hypothetical protein ABFX02_06G201817 [Erythranthe guttata]